MAVVDILIGENNPMLRTETEKVASFGKELKRLIEDLEETASAAEGAGLAAPQVGVLQSVCVARIAGKFVALVNPEILWKSPATEYGEEGCLSLPDLWLSIPRSKEIILRFHDSTGKVQERQLSGWDARVVQHEIDHLHGRLIVDYHAERAIHHTEEL